MSFIQTRGLSRSFVVPGAELFQPPHRTLALRHTDLEIDAGETVGIIGESGSGKSTLVRLLLALDRPTTGEIHIDGKRVDAAASARSLHWLRRLTGLVFQDPYSSLDPRLSVEQIIREPLWALDIPGDHGARVREVLSQVGLEADMAARYPHEFSGGQRQRIALARAIAHRPRILVGDEPLSALDVTVRAQILDLLEELRATEQLTLLMISHDIGVVQKLCSSVMVMRAGEIVERGTTAQVLRTPVHEYTQRLLSAIPVIPQHPVGDA